MHTKHPDVFHTFLMAVWLVLAGFCSTAASLASPSIKCSSLMSERAESLLSGARADWTSLLKHQKTFSSCDDGGLGEGYSEAVAHLFSERWEQFSIFADLARKNADFQKWAILHIDATASDEGLKKILINTSTCIDRSDVGSICKSIRHAAENALTESARLRQ